MKLQSLILNWVVKNLFHGVNADDIITIKKGARRDNAFCRGLKVSDEHMKRLMDEANYFEESLFWKEICDRGIRYSAQEKSIEGGDKDLAQGMIIDLNFIKQSIRDIKNFKIGRIK